MPLAQHEIQKLLDEFGTLRQTSQIVRGVDDLIQNGSVSPEHGLMMLACEMQRYVNYLFAEYRKAAAISPSRVRDPDGNILRFDVPDEHVPIVNFDE